MLPKPRTPQPPALRQLRRQLLMLQHPMFWGTGAVLLLSGWFLMEHWQSRAAFNSTEITPAQHNNPLRYGASNADSYRGGSLPDLPQPVLPNAANAQIPIDPTLPQPAQSSQNKAQTRTASQTPSGSGTSKDPLLDLYNPTGIPMPRAWETPSAPSQLSQTESGQAPSESGTTANRAAPATSPLQSALDRASMPAALRDRTSAPAENRSLLPQSPEAVGVSSMGSGAMQSSSPGITSGGSTGAGAMGIGQSNSTQMLSQSSYSSTPSSTPRTAEYTLPPAFRTTENTTPYYNNSPYSSPATSPAQSATPESSSSLPLSPSTVPQQSPGQAMPGRSPAGEIGGGGMNTFSNP